MIWPTVPGQMGDDEVHGDERITALEREVKELKELALRLLARLDQVPLESQPPLPQQR
jgi:hypothetical protein